MNMTNVLVIIAVLILVRIVQTAVMLKRSERKADEVDVTLELLKGYLDRESKRYLDEEW